MMINYSYIEPERNTSSLYQEQLSGYRLLFARYILEIGNDGRLATLYIHSMDCDTTCELSIVLVF